MNTLLALDLAGNFQPGGAILAGVVGALAMLMVIYGGRSMGMTSMDLLRTLGTMVAPRAEAGSAHAIGLMMHLMMGAGFGLVHAGLLHAAGPTSTGAATGLGLLFGLVHGLVVTVMMPVLLSMAHPLVRSGELTDPGIAMTGFGRMTPAGVAMAHAVFGIVAGAVYIATL